MQASWWHSFLQRIQRGDATAIVAAAAAIVIVVTLVWLLAQRGDGLDHNAAKPPIPAEIDQGEGEVPQLSVYIADQDVTETMTIDRYLEGVVAAEMDPEWPLEALKAQAIIARTFTLQQIAENGTVAGTDAHASTDHETFQAFDASRVNDRVRRAVSETSGQIIAYQGDYARTWFHAYSGGHTTTPEVGLDWEGPHVPYLQPVNDAAFDEAIPEDVRFWEATFSRDDFADAVADVTGERPDAGFTVEINERSDDGRAVTLSVGGIVVSAPSLRLALDSGTFRSTLLDDIAVDQDRITLSGRGYGHGVGLSQWGARVMSDRGKSAAEIIDYYYKGVDLVRLWSASE